MSKTRTIGQMLWIGIRFIMFGLVGWWVMFYGIMGFLQRVLEGPQFDKGGYDVIGISPLFSLPLGLLGAAMMLFGVGEWKRWRYLLVFLLMPISLYASVHLGLIVLPLGAYVVTGVVAVCTFATYAAVRKFYHGHEQTREKETNP